jgi:hypothetical protein
MQSGYIYITCTLPNLINSSQLALQVISATAAVWCLYTLILDGNSRLVNTNFLALLIYSLQCRIGVLCTGREGHSGGNLYSLYTHGTPVLLTPGIGTCMDYSWGLRLAQTVRVDDIW